MVCENANAREISMGILGTAVLGCTASPLPGSRYCGACREYAARRSSGPAQPGNQSVTHIDFGVAPGAAASCREECCDAAQCGECKPEAPAPGLPADPAAGAAAGAAGEELSPDEELSPGEEDVYLVEKLVGHKPLTKSNAPGHSRCLKCAPPPPPPTTTTTHTPIARPRASAHRRGSSAG